MLKRCALVLFSCLLMTAVSEAAVISAIASLTGPGENPSNASPGIGSGTVTIDTILNTMRVQVAFSGLTSTTMASHIHCCTTPPNAVGVATTVPTFPGFPLGVTAGTYDQTFDLTSASSYNPTFVTNNGGGTVAGAESALITGIQAGQAYLNIHTVAFPGGEIRGFLAVVPEPGTTLLMAAGLGALLLTWRTRRASH
jgi:hypothetical protein